MFNDARADLHRYHIYHPPQNRVITQFDDYRKDEEQGGDYGRNSVEYAAQNQDMIIRGRIAHMDTVLRHHKPSCLNVAICPLLSVGL